MNKKSVLPIIVTIIIILGLIVYYVISLFYKPLDVKAYEKGDMASSETLILDENGVAIEANGVELNDYYIVNSDILPRNALPLSKLTTMNDDIGNYLKDLNYSGDRSLSIIQDSISVSGNKTSFWMPIGDRYLCYTYDKSKDNCSFSISDDYSKGKIETATTSKYESKSFKIPKEVTLSSSLRFADWSVLKELVYDYITTYEYSTDTLSVIDGSYVEDDETIAFELRMDGYPQKKIIVSTDKKTAPDYLFHMHIETE